MHIDPVEIYSDASNAAVMRHPERRFPGCLIQGDSLHILVSSLVAVQAEAGCLSEEAAGELAAVTEQLTQLLEHYKATLLSHNLDLPFYEPPRV
jgi:predicted RNase H-like HicB family nuclease